MKNLEGHHHKVGRKKETHQKAPLKKERKFIKLHGEFAETKEALELSKEELRALRKKGFDFTLVRFIPSSQFKPPWRDLCDELH